MFGAADASAAVTSSAMTSAAVTSMLGAAVTFILLAAVTSMLSAAVTYITCCRDFGYWKRYPNVIWTFFDLKVKVLSKYVTSGFGVTTYIVEGNYHT